MPTVSSVVGAGPAAKPPFNHWCRCPKVSLGPSGPPFIGEVSPEALPQASVHCDSHLGPVPPAYERSSATVSKPAAGRPGRWGGGWCVSNYSKPLNVFQARLSLVVPTSFMPLPHGLRRRDLHVWCAVLSPARSPNAKPARQHPDRVVPED